LAAPAARLNSKHSSIAAGIYDEVIITMNPMTEIDWNEVWKDQMRRSEEVSTARECASIWESRESALKFWNMSKNNRHRVEETIAETEITSESRVLDIGAGPGTLAIPFSKRVSHVTVVEPAEGMTSVLREKMAEEGVDNIDIVQKRWEDVNVADDLNPPYDVVIASYSLGMPDIRSAIENMIEAAAPGGHIYLYHFAGETHWDGDGRYLWPRLHGKEYQPGPKSDVLYNVLYSMGIYPHIRSFRLQHVQRFGSMDAAMEHFHHEYRISTPEQEAIVAEYLARVLKEENGGFVLPASSIRVKIWWEKGLPIDDPNWP
jgi:ubiquinone/menaquinone biosynthesis C-methylase UbiE